MNELASMKEFFNHFHKVPETVLDDYLSNWEEYSLPAKTVMTAPGETEKYLYYVLEGIQKSYYLTDDKMHVIAFVYAPSFSGIPESILTKSPSKYYLETISDSKFRRIPISIHEEFMNKHRDIETLYRKYTEQILVGLLERYYELMAFDIETRFTTFVKRSPHLLSMVSQKDLASYLRIDPTNFSKLINRVRI